MSDKTVTTPKKLYLWQINNDVFVAYDNPYPCDHDGNPLVCGEPNATATLCNSHPGISHDN